MLIIAYYTISQTQQYYKYTTTNNMSIFDSISHFIVVISDSFFFSYRTKWQRSIEIIKKNANCKIIGAKLFINFTILIFHSMSLNSLRRKDFFQKIKSIEMLFWSLINIDFLQSDQIWLANQVYCIEKMYEF